MALTDIFYTSAATRFRRCEVHANLQTATKMHIAETTLRLQLQIRKSDISLAMTKLSRSRPGRIKALGLQRTLTLVRKAAFPCFVAAKLIFMLSYPSTVGLLQTDGPTDCWFTTDRPIECWFTTEKPTHCWFTTK